MTSRTPREIILENALAELGAILDWVMEVAEGHEVSDFAESFAPVRRMMDLRQQWLAGGPDPVELTLREIDEAAEDEQPSHDG